MTAATPSDGPPERRMNDVAPPATRSEVPRASAAPRTPSAPRPSMPPGAMPVFKYTLRLNTDFAQRVYRRAFDRLKADLYVLTVRTRASGMDEAADAIEAIISEAFASARKDLEAELERSDVLLDDVKLSDMAEYERALVTQAAYSTPRAREFLDLLLKLDQLLMRYDALWLSGYIETRPRVARSQNWQRRMVKIANRLRELGNRTRASLTREAEKRNGTGPAAEATGTGAGIASPDATAAVSSEAADAAGDAEDLEGEGGGSLEEVPEEFRDPADRSSAGPEGGGTTLEAPEAAAGSEGVGEAPETPPDPLSAPRSRRRRVADTASG